MAKGMPQKLLWLDLEMTGLNPETDHIVEVAAIVTDFKFNEIDMYESVIKQSKRTLDRTKKQDWYDWSSGKRQRTGSLYDLFDKNGLIQASLASAKTVKQVEKDLLSLVDKHFDEAPCLAGNSIHNDRAFVKRWWPKLEQKLHYRMLDVTSFKLWWQGSQKFRYYAPDSHRALDGIRGSIAEMKFYSERIRD